jgi:hypothetical protein
VWGSYRCAVYQRTVSPDPAPILLALHKRSAFHVSIPLIIVRGKVMGYLRCLLRAAGDERGMRTFDQDPTYPRTALGWKNVALMHIAGFFRVEGWPPPAAGGHVVAGYSRVG